MLKLRLLALSILFLAPIYQVNGQEKNDVKKQVEEFKNLTLQWVKVLNTKHEEQAHENMDKQRERVVSLGPKAIKQLKPLLKHDQVNLRRGTAITFLFLVEKHRVQDEKLLDFILLRMVEDPDIKARSNLYHVTKAIVANMMKSPKTKTQKQ